MEFQPFTTVDSTGPNSSDCFANHGAFRVNDNCRFLGIFSVGLRPGCRRTIQVTQLEAMAALRHGFALICEELA